MASIWDLDLAWLTPDIILACLIPLTILLVSYRTLSFTSPNSTPAPSAGPFSLPTALAAYTSYPSASASELARMRASYSTLSRAHKRVGYDIGYVGKLDRVAVANAVNSIVTGGIAELAREDSGAGEQDGGGRLLLGGWKELLSGKGSGANGGGGSVGRVREALKHFVRDWSEEGREEREVLFKPILDVLRQVPEAERSTQKVLVPGCGLGRLAWDISSELGFDTTANELSYYMILALRFLLHPSSTPSTNLHTIRPYAHWFSHQRTTCAVFRGVSFPDALPRLSNTFHLLPADFLTLAPPSPSRGYHAIVTLFFIDTSLNVFSTIEHIYSLLRPGGAWINLGPLLWTGGAQAKVELSLEEVMKVVERTGFVVDVDGPGRGMTVDGEYTKDREAMMRWIYQAEFWVARKPK